MVRLKDIAVRAGVSVMTVSKVMRDTSDISASTKARIRQLAEQMGYNPDSIAQGLRTGTTKLLVSSFPPTTNPVFARVVMAIEERAHEMGYDLITAHSLNIPEREEAVIKRLLSRRIDGLFLVPVYRLDPTAPIYEELARRGIPTVLLGHKAPFCQKFPNVETDDINASYALTQHLLQLGHKRIAYFTGPPVSPGSQERFEGYRRALREAQIEVDEKLIFNAGATIEEGEKAALQMLNEAPKATAIQAVNDLVAIGACKPAAEPGRPHPAGHLGGWLRQCFDQRTFSGAADHDSPAQAAPGRGRRRKHDARYARRAGSHQASRRRNRHPPELRPACGQTRKPRFWSAGGPCFGVCPDGSPRTFPTRHALC
jgi:LacI family transcriptional regulator